MVLVVSRGFLFLKSLSLRKYMNDSQQLTDVGELMLLVDMSCIDVISCFCLSSSRGVRWIYGNFGSLWF